MITEVRARTAIQTDADTLLAALDTALAFVNKNDTRPVLQAVKIESTASGTKFASADGWHLGIVDVAESLGELDTLIHSDSIKAIVKMLKSVSKHQRASVQVTLDNERCDIPNVGTIPVQVVAGTFPDFEKLVPEVETQVSRTDRFALNANLLVKVATVAGRYNSSAQPVIRFDTPASRKTPITATWDITKHVSVRYVLMPMFVKWIDEPNS